MEFLHDSDKYFVPTQEIDCPCGTTIQTRQHITLECRLHQRHRHTPGYGRNAQWGRLTGTYKGINKLITFIKHSNAFDKQTLQDPNTNERRDGELIQETSST